MNKTKHDWSRLDAMTEEQRHAAALADPDAQPLTDADMDRMRQTPRLKIIRRALGLTQEEFAARFQIPLGTLRDWEQGAKQPDWAARAYLRAIAGDPGRGGAGAARGTASGLTGGARVCEPHDIEME